MIFAHIHVSNVFKITTFFIKITYLNMLQTKVPLVSFTLWFFFYFYLLQF
jgi:hypothetical protein